jgi:predicted ATP-grasp superfamily ATP-dependent carboligase
MTREGLNHPSTLIDTVRKITEKLHQRAIIIPASDDAAMTISLSKSGLERYADVPIPSAETVGICLSKIAIHRAGERLGLPHPNAYFPEGLGEVSRVAGSIEYPCVLKPDDSKEFYRALGVKAIIAKSRDELLRSYETAAKHKVKVFVQEHIPGETDSNYGFAAFFDRDSRPHCGMTYRRIREWPPHSPGVAAMAISVAVPELVDQATKFFSGLGFHGIVQAEFKRDPRDDIWKILDVNPRAWTSNRLATRCGCNIPLAAFLDSVGLGFEKPSMRQGVIWMNFREAFFSSLSAWRRRRLSLSECLRPLRGEIVYAVYDRNDVAPSIWGLRPGL